jgi:molybdopterin/thiamine biosynthesis adenylyltransferase
VTSDVSQPDRCSAQLLHDEDADDRCALEVLRADPRIELVDRWREQAESLRRLRPVPEPELIAEPPRWAYYPWRRTVVSVLGPRAFRALRLDRNRNLITVEEQDTLGRLRVGVIGLSAGHIVAHTLAAEGLCGELRLADFDQLDLSNLNRVPATVLDLGVNKATVAARRIAELDPYLTVRVLTSGLTPDNIDEFLEGLDIVVEEADSLDMKALVREAARARGLPVLMATSDRGLVDIERYDLEPLRPVLHGLLSDTDIAGLSNLSSREKLPHVLRILDGAGFSARGAASLIEIGHTLTTWPQRSGEVAIGGATVAEAVRRIGLGEALPSGRVRVDIAKALDRLDQPARPPDSPTDPEGVPPAIEPSSPSDIADTIGQAAIRAPSGGNAQPWHVEADQDAITVWLAPECTTAMDVCFRGSAVAVGAAAFNARIAAAAHGVAGPVEFAEGSGRSPLQATMRLDSGDDPHLAQLYRPMLARETNRHHGKPEPVAAETVGLLQSAARREGAQLQLLIGRDQIDKAATILAAADRIRYLTPRLHAEMASELRWPGEQSLDSGIDVRSLELGPGELLALDILRRPEVMAQLADWDAGAALGADTYARASASSALGVVSVRGHTLTDYAHGGAAMEAVWIAAQQRGVAVQPLAPVFLFAQTRDDLNELSPTFASALHQLQTHFRELAGTGPDETQVLVLRFSDAPPASVRSRRRSLGDVCSPSG